MAGSSLIRQTPVSETGYALPRFERIITVWPSLLDDAAAIVARQTVRTLAHHLLSRSA